MDNFGVDDASDGMTPFTALQLISMCYLVTVPSATASYLVGMLRYMAREEDELAEGACQAISSFNKLWVEGALITSALVRTL